MLFEYDNFIFVFQPTAVIADLSEKDLIAKFDKAASSVIDKLVRINLKSELPPLLFYAPYRNLKQAIIPKKAFYKFNLILEEKLLAYGKNKIRLAVSENRFVKTNQKFKAADYIMTPKIALKNQDVTLVFRIIDAKHNETVISETVYIQKVSPQLLTEETNAMSLKEALDDIAEICLPTKYEDIILYLFVNIRKWRFFDQVRSVFYVNW